MNRQILAASALTFALSAVAAAPASAADSDLWFHVTVDEQRGERAQIKIHLPLKLVERLAPMLSSGIDHRGSRFRINQREVTPAEAREMWRALRDADEAPFVDVRSGRDRVRISKSAGMLHLRATDDRPYGEDVRVRIPEAVVDALLSGDEGEYEIAAALRVLARQGAGDLVQIDSDDADVRIWIDGSQAPEERR